MKKNRVFLRGPASKRPGKAVVPNKPCPCATCATDKSAVMLFNHPSRNPAPKEAASTLLNVPRDRGNIVKPSVVDETIQLRLGKSVELQGNIVSQLGQRQQAAVGDELRRIETAAEQASAIAAELPTPGRVRAYCP